MKMITLLCFVAWVPVLWAGPARGGVPDSGAFGQPAYHFIEGAADTAAVFEEFGEPQTRRRILAWAEGSLSRPDSLDLEEWGPFDQGVPFTARLFGQGEFGRLILQDGIFPISEPVILADGRVELSVRSGELEIRGARIIYRRTASGPGDFRSGLLMFAGMTLLVVVLVRRARIKASAGMGR